ncbi:MAG: biotin carboxylase N-terminal domain-containing protein, partial [Saprospiraceae bacterium]|nr:biotin carboxylase N-terminal domain-containing protein [Saprospiraceae bacterium]
MKEINTILIANRGEIARRIILSCRKLGIRSVALYDSADQRAAYLRLADMAVRLPGESVGQTYLNEDLIIGIALEQGADAIHPGYGFLSERAGFARKTRDAGLIFIGPPTAAIQKMGSKAEAKAIMEAEGIPVIPGYRGEDQSDDKLMAEAEKTGFPLLVKAAAGGGGKGMSIVGKVGELTEALARARREAEAAFGDDRLILERYFPGARHIEIQILGDQHGRLVHLRERECSLQRRYQKIVEESPSPALDKRLRDEIAAVALKAARTLNYYNAGTVEFLLDSRENFYFLEMNTRLQVEHPVTEAICGLDLVALQIRVAEGAPLPFRQEDIRFQGHAIECRLYAEDPSNDFLPTGGTLLYVKFPDQEGLRIDHGPESEEVVTTQFDPLLAKIIAHGTDRPQAIRRMRHALEKLVALGFTTNQKFLWHLLGRSDFKEGSYHTQTVESITTTPQEEEVPFVYGLAATFFRVLQRKRERPFLAGLPPGWRNNPHQPQEERYRIKDENLVVIYTFRNETMLLHRNQSVEEARCLEWDGHYLRLAWKGKQYQCWIARQSDRYFLHIPPWGPNSLRVQPRYPEVETEELPGSYAAPMPAR